MKSLGTIMGQWVGEEWNAVTMLWAGVHANMHDILMKM